MHIISKRDLLKYVEKPDREIGDNYTVRDYINSEHSIPAWRRHELRYQAGVRYGRSESA